MQKKRVPKDTTALQKKIEERKKEEIDKVEERFAQLLRDSKAMEKMEENKYEEEKKEEKKEEEKKD